MASRILVVRRSSPFRKGDSTMPVQTNALKLVYDLLATKPLLKGYSPDFQYWHVEGLLSQASQILQRCVDERNEYYLLLAQKTAAEDQLARETNEITSLRNRNADGAR